MKKLEENIRKVVPYVPGEQPKVTGELIKLNTNENPYPPSPKVLQALANMSAEEMRLYPSVTASPLTEALAAYHGIKPSELFVGVGSDDVLAICFLTFFAGKKPILFPDITYSFYDVWAKLYQIPFERIPLTSDFRISQKDYLRENGGIVIANPNAPTSIGAPLSQLEEVIAGNPDSVVIIDEAYVDYGGESVLPLIQKYENLVVVRTFSKSRAFAGMRIGYAMANESLIKAMQDVKFSVNSYTMNAAALSLGVAVLSDESYFRAQLDRVLATRERTERQLSELGFTLLPSATNFLFATHATESAERIFEYLKSKQIYVRYFKKPRIENFLRITIGTDAQMQRLAEVLQEYFVK